MFRQSLDSRWTLSAAGGDAPLDVKDVPATVPGCVHTDLLAAGLIPDPYLDRNDLELTWIGRTDWRYVCRFDAGAKLLEHEHVDLACDGLDTVATLTLNGKRIGESANMHVRRRFAVRDALHAGNNELVIEFAAPVTFAQKMLEQHPGRPWEGAGSNPPLPHHMIRKMACNFGWDWGPPLVTCGVWRPIRLEAWNEARLAAVRPHVLQADEKRAAVRVEVEVEGAAEKLTAVLTDPHGRRVAEAAFGAGDSPVLEVDRPRLWWPVGYGDQPLYALQVTLGQEDVWAGRIGLRTVKLVTEPDPDTPPGKVEGLGRGSGMAIHVNGQRVFCKGANWIPDDCFPSRITPERYRRRITQARDANMNMLRVWGGGIYEGDAFYEVCDELGVMVWQDFLCACACYPEEEPYRGWFEAEAADNINRLCAHPSLVLWNGCNENIWGVFDWSQAWRDMRSEGAVTWGLGYYLDLFPRLVGKLDPTRPYWPASPYSGSMDIHPNANEQGNRHVWNVWHGPGHYRNYLAHFPRFASEFGFHGPATWPTIARSTPPGQRRWDSPTSKHHNKNNPDGQAKMNERIAEDFAAPPPTLEGFDDWLYLGQVAQARALSMGVEWFRALDPWCSGALFWQLNDCWPVTSWSAIDADGRPKPMWFAARRFNAPRLVTIKPRRVTPVDQPIGPLAAYLHNDSDQRWRGALALRRLSLGGDVLDETSREVDIEPRGLERFDMPDAWHNRADRVLLAELDTARGWWFFAPDRELAYPPPAFDAQLARTGDQYVLKITARTLLRDLCVFADRLDPQASVSDQFATLLPNETHAFRITSRQTLDRQKLLSPPVLQCANRFGAARRVASA